VGAKGSPDAEAPDCRRRDGHDGRGFRAQRTDGRLSPPIGDPIRDIMIRIDPEPVVPLTGDAAARAYLAPQ
jgi:hypothetical protein